MNVNEHGDPARLAYGSLTATATGDLVAGNDTVSIVAAGTDCVFDGLLVTQGDNQRRTMELQTASGVYLTQYDINPILQKSRRYGSGGAGIFGPTTGIRSTDGLQIVLEAGSTTATGCTVLYRTL